MTKLYEAMVMAGITQRIELFNECGYTSKNLYEQISLLTEEQQKAIQSGFAWIQQNGFQDDVVVIGGTAVASHVPGGRKLTPDLDILVKSLSPFTELFHQQKINYESIADSAMVASLSFSGITVDVFNADFMMWQNRRLNSLVFSTAVRQNIGGVNWRVIDSALLMCMKSQTGRQKDMEDMILLWKKIQDKAEVQKMAKQLIAIGVMTKEEYTDMKSFMF